MKNVKKITLAIMCIVIAATSFNSCKKKELLLVAQDIPSNLKSVPFHVKYNAFFDGKTCMAGSGFCFKQLANVEELQSVVLNADEGKGTAWASMLANGNILLTMHSSTLNLSPLLTDQLLADKSMTISDGAFLPDDLVNSSLIAGKITFPPNNCCHQIPAGKHPVKVSTPPQTLPKELTIQVTLSSKLDYVGHVTLLR